MPPLRGSLKMDDLIEALNILKKYNNPNSYTSKNPFHCEHDELSVFVDRFDEITEEDFAKLDELGFLKSYDEDHFISYRYGSC